MKTVAGIADKRSRLRVARSMESEVTSVTSHSSALRFHAPMRSRRWIPLGVLLLALVPSCNSLWHSYLEPCDPASPTCLALDASIPDLVPPTPTPQLVPSNGIDPAWFAEASGELSPTEDLLIDTDQGTVLTQNSKVPIPNVIHRKVAPVDCGASWPVGIGVFSFTRIHIPGGVTVRFTGSHAAALIASGSITIEGLLDLRGGACTDPRCGGPGGFAGGHVRNPIRRGEGPGSGTEGYGIGGEGDEAGGGGAGACGKGGKGADAGSTYPGGVGGSTYLKDALIPLCGGSGGGAGGFGTTMGESGQRGGGGGGAIQIVSKQSVTVSSTSASSSGIQVGGGGGQGDIGMNFNDGGGGGGSGGAILIEAPIISILSGAVLAANGGGGGGGYNNMQPTLHGEPGKLSSVAAVGGAGSRSSGGAGGASQGIQGSAATGPLMDGGGGGGGGVGRIRLNSLDGNVTINGTLSPPIGSCASVGRVTMR